MSSNDEPGKITGNTDSNSIILSKEFFLAEYNSLRGEIQQRISHQTTIVQVAITAWGVIISYALGRIEDVNSYNDVYLILAYPLLAFFISHAWAFNNTRICQLAGYLRNRENVFGKKHLMNWENHVYNLDKEEKRTDFRYNHFLYKGVIKMFDGITGTHKVKPGVAILAGTQVLSIIVAMILIVVHIGAANEVIVNTTSSSRTIDTTRAANRMTITRVETTRRNKDNINGDKDNVLPNRAAAPMVLLLVDLMVIYTTWQTLSKSERDYL